MKIFKKIKNIARSPKSKHGKSVNNQAPLLFHPVHGDNIRITGNGTTARRLESFCEGIVFSARPVRIGERVTIKFVENSTTWSGALRFGFTTTDPAKLKGHLPKYACPELTSKPGFWAKALSERYSVPETILAYWVDESGKVHYSINGEDKGIYLTDVDVDKPFWALLDIYGYTTSIKFLDPRYICKNRPTDSIYSASQPSHQSPQSPVYSTLPRTVKREPLPQIYRNSNLTPLPFHRTRGCNITLSNDGCIAERCDSQYSRGYVFSQRPLRLGEKLVIQILKTDELYTGSLAFGLTTCNPSILNSADLPEDPHSLLDRPEYWIVIKDVANSPTPGDEISFKITETGQVVMTKNRQPPVTLMHIDHTQSFYPFFDLYGSTIKVKSLGVMIPEKPIHHNQYNHQHSHQHLSSNNKLPVYTRKPLTPHQKWRSTYGLAEKELMTNISSYNNQQTRYEYRTLSESQSHSTGSLNVESECTVCFEAPINSVLYACGHMCMCYDCAFKQWKGQGGGRCPICRARILDVIRTYYA